MQTNGKHHVWSDRIAIGGTILVLALAIFFIGYLAANGDDIPPTPHRRRLHRFHRSHGDAACHHDQARKRCCTNPGPFVTIRLPRLPHLKGTRTTIVPPT